jgi:hypothetical protein
MANKKDHLTSQAAPAKRVLDARRARDQVCSGPGFPGKPHDNVYIVTEQFCRRTPLLTEAKKGTRRGAREE